ncbi:MULTISPECIES: ABC transporter substrate-binding protein [Rhizobium/Agrobacterium group]|uniref:ABC transporter substrate-binding protein n=1 Tax=Rhizobium/Agrobacterium group TaxID=227290 RepID=UPI001ADC023D|nr:MULTISPECIES: ABC transporter substrate-binding protein [Rhizobium/Agrobacterium group]MBO9112423.1 ABC transporter substrate-binding protein [Agrobacterium sp. S2/73]QXZ75931.1 ABC transporter substrate-binding protein [Agrobacterium sp. S7/73]QYA17058.1 ABC transporter substrate-binding protein [Rhizobium sp. AB2/73]UEQ85369.1 ABC transporter substrate-binding protein [Rhizobium sp. AB2/73]
MLNDISRRTVLKTLSAGVAASTFPSPFVRRSFAADPILLGLPVSQTAMAGVADHQDYLNGTTLALEEINAAGGVLGREIKPVVVDFDVLSPESGRVAVNSLVDAKVHAMSTAFTFTPIPLADASASYKAPLLWGLTQRAMADALVKNPEKYRHIFQTDPSEVHYGYTFPMFLQTMQDKGVWKPKNNGVHIVQEQIAYNQTISKCLQEALPKSKFELAGITDIQYPVQDWGPVIQDIKKIGAGAVMIDHWVAAEYAAFVKQYQADPLEGTLVYLQYGPSQPEFLELSGPAAEGFVWSTVLGVYADEKGKAFREKYQKRFPGIMGLCYTGNGYDTTYYLKAAWEAVGDPSKFEAVADWIRTNPYRGVCGYMSMGNAFQECAHYPDNGYDVTATELDRGMAQLFFQVQDGEHKIIYPDALQETELRAAPWW